MQEHRVPGIHNETMYCGSASNHSRKEVNGSVTAAAFRESRQQEEIMCPILESSGNNHPHFMKTAMIQFIKYSVTTEQLALIDFFFSQ